MRRNNHRSFAGFSHDRWGHLYILSQLLSRARSSPYTIQLTAHLIVLTEYLLIPHPIVHQVH